MRKVQTVNFRDFMDGSFKKKALKKDVHVISKILTTSGAIVTATMPKIVLAAAMEGAFGNIHGAIMRGFDAGVVLVIIFAGAAWGLGHRTKAIEILIGVCCGFILANHAVDIRNFLRGIQEAVQLAKKTSKIKKAIRTTKKAAKNTKKVVRKIEKTLSKIWGY